MRRSVTGSWPRIRRSSRTINRCRETAGDEERLRAAVQALPPDQRAAIALFHFEDMSIAEVAVALDVPAGTVKTRLMHARRKLRAALEGDE